MRIDLGGHAGDVDTIGVYPDVKPIMSQGAGKTAKGDPGDNMEYEEEVVYEYEEEDEPSEDDYYEEEVVYEYEKEEEDEVELPPQEEIDKILREADSEIISDDTESLPIAGLQNQVSLLLETMTKETTTSKTTPQPTVIPTIPLALAEVPESDPETGVSGVEVNDEQETNIQNLFEGATPDKQEEEDEEESELSQDQTETDLSLDIEQVTPKKTRVDWAQPIDMTPNSDLISPRTRPQTPASAVSMFHTTAPKSRLQLPPPARTPTPEYARSIDSLEQFKSMLRGPPKKKSTYWKFLRSKRQPESGLSYNEILAIAKNQLEKKPRRNPELDNPAVVADVVDVLGNMKVESVQECNYVKSKRISETIDRLRATYRNQDRMNFHNERVEGLKRRLDNIKDEVHVTTEQWKRRQDDLKYMSKEELAALDEKHEEQMRELEEGWQTSSKARKFAKKSSALLHNLTIEKHLVLTGDFDRAAEMRKINHKIEKNEIEAKSHDREVSFEQARQHLLNTQERERQDLLTAQAGRKAVLKKRETHELNVLARRQQAVEGMVAEDGDYNNFCAKKFKKSAEVIVPMTVTMNGGSDIPVAGKARASMRDVDNLQTFRSSSVAAPLVLPPLQVKRLRKTKRLNESEEGKKKRDDF